MRLWGHFVRGVKDDDGREKKSKRIAQQNRVQGMRRCEEKGRDDGEEGKSG